MHSSSRASLVGRLLERFHFRYPTLVFLLGTLTLVDFIVPDFIPFVDEIGLALLTLLFGMWKDRKAPLDLNSSEYSSVPDDRPLD